MEWKLFVRECRSFCLTGVNGRYSVCSALTNSFLFENCCSLSDQNSFLPTSNRSPFVLAIRDRDRANKNEFGIFVSSVTSNDFPHAMLPDSVRTFGLRWDYPKNTHWNPMRRIAGVGHNKLLSSLVSVAPSTNTQLFF